jgi:hypothetical protein
MDCRAELRVDLSGVSTTTEAFDTDSEVIDALRRNKLFKSGASYTRTDPGLTVAPSRFKSKLTLFRINWMILRRLFVPQAATYRTSCRTIIEGFVFGLSTYNVMVPVPSASTNLLFPSGPGTPPIPWGESS